MSDEQNPVHVYAASGTFTVSLETANADGSDTKTRPDYITVTSVSGPGANFTAHPTCGKAPLQVTLRDTSTGTPFGWYWNFGDGTNASVQNPVHTYTGNGKYTVSLTVTNAGGSSTKTRTEYISVSGSSARPPVAKFTGKPTGGTAPLTVVFTDRSTGTPSGWYWNFGDGMNSTEQHPVHIYTAPGKYTVSLKVTNGAGSNTRTERKYITVKTAHPPSADFSGKPRIGNAPLAVQFHDTSDGSPTEWYWKFGDGSNSTQQHPVHLYTSAGRYTVVLTASNTGGSSTKARTQYISVYAPAPTPTPTPSYPVPLVNATIEDCKVRLNWDVITDSRL